MRDQALDNLFGSPRRSEAPYDSLMPNRVNNLLLVTSLYDCYTFIEDGRLSEMLFSEYLELNLRFAPSIERVSTGHEAIERLQSEHFDLVISMPRVGEMNVREFGRAVQEIAPGVSVVLLAANTRELSTLQSISSLPGIDRVFVWLGDVRLFLAMIKNFEDRQNAWHDARTAGVKSILLVEDSPQFYSSYLPLLYTEIMRQTQSLMSDSVNRMQRVMRMRARPKILLADSYEEAVVLYERYKHDLLGVILDANVPRAGKEDRGAGLDFAHMLKDQGSGIPILLQSSADLASQAASAGIQYLDKNSPNLLANLRSFLRNYLGFGDFRFLMPDSILVSRVSDLRDLEWAVRAVPDECLMHHSGKNDLSIWLMARTEFELADSVRQILQSDVQNPELIRQELLKVLSAHRMHSRAGVVAEFSPGTYSGDIGLTRIGSGSLGGKGRGLAFINSLIINYRIADHFPGIKIHVPPTAILATGVFDQFMEASGLLPFAMQETDDDNITRAFLEAELADEVVDHLWNFLDWVRYPLAVRSSSLLEDASYQPFAGIYSTYMIPNSDDNPEVRLQQLCDAIRMVYASTYHSDPKVYIQSTPNRLEEEKMAVVIQQVVGRPHGEYLYPDIAGVARSLNFYPMPGMKPEEGVASVVLGLGKAVVDGGRCVRFSPAHPRKPMQSFSPKDYLNDSQRSFLALNTSPAHAGRMTRGIPDLSLEPLGLDVAEKHGTLHPVGSVYSPDGDAVYDGLSRKGVRLVTMAGVLKASVFPLAEVLSLLLKAGSAASSCPVEMEFAVGLSSTHNQPHEFAFLQIRPLVLGSDAQDILIEDIDPRAALCVAHSALGNGFIHGVRDLVYVRMETFERSQTPQIAREIGEVATRLRQAGRPFLLLGPGRWGSADPWLGIPVRWADIAGVSCIIETDLADMHVDPSQGSHFFHNMMSFGIGYLTANPGKGDILDWNWLSANPAIYESNGLRHLEFASSLEIALNGRRNYGVVMKPGARLAAPDS